MVILISIGCTEMIRMHLIVHLTQDMVLNDATPEIKVNPETFEVTADGEALSCEPVDVVPLARKYFLF